LDSEVRSKDFFLLFPSYFLLEKREIPMKLQIHTCLFFIVCLFFLLGCETVKKTTSAGGEALGKGADALGGISEGGLDGYMGPEDESENPYGR